MNFGHEGGNVGFDHAETVRFSARSSAKGVGIFLLDVVLLLAFLTGALYATEWWMQAGFSVAVGIMTAVMFVVAHDAAHNSLTPHRWLNGLIGRLAMLPSLHTFSLWQLVHNQTHHRWTNLSPNDYVWTPLSRSEYDALSGFQKTVYRFYRGLLGPLAYYFFEFWIKRIMFPSRKEVRGNYKTTYVLDITLVAAFAACYIFFLIVGGSEGWFGTHSAWNALLFGFALPYFVWNVIMAFVIYLHHTHPSIRWFNNKEAWRADARQSQSSVHVIFPGPINFLFHWIMEHNAHHERPSIPLYNLRSAQKHLAAKEQDHVVFQWTPVAHMDVVNRCKLYDFEAFRWMDFDGNYTSDPVVKPTPTQLQPHFVRQRSIRRSVRSRSKSSD